MTSLTHQEAATPYDQGVAEAVSEVETAPEGRWVPTGAGVALRLLGCLVLAYFTVTGGAFVAGAVIATAAVAVIVASFALVALRLVGRSHLEIAVIVVLIVAGAVTTPYVTYVAGGYYFYGAVLLIARTTLPLRTAVAIAAGGGVLLLVVVAREVEPNSLTTAMLSYGAGILAAVFFAITRRQARQRQVQDAALVARNRELERRSAELIVQTELTRTETGRAAALEERSRIARDIHDVLAHSLGGLVRQLDAAEALLTERQDVPAAAERLRASRQLAVEGLREARMAVSELRSSDRESSAEQDLVAAVRHTAFGPVGIHLGVELDLLGQPRTVPGAVGEAFVAVTREGLTNVTKHAPGGQVALSLIFADAAVRLEIGNSVPDGPSSDLASTGGGVGVAGMRERMVAIGGTLTTERQGCRWILSAEWRS